ncbi:hypothetical protein O181_017306 [Austropuccinia psidii MF-1]|uniref:Uncharacterized protein n=1 Tax=Austropuccinia psidii MF-1 TaxID=1389203 RepID=A0A9Q3C7C3_9BASI|nr:hypothetical protein [Austropuccinia psidii MF-1]
MRSGGINFNSVQGMIATSTSHSLKLENTQVLHGSCQQNFQKGLTLGNPLIKARIELFLRNPLHPNTSNFTSILAQLNYIRFKIQINESTKDNLYLGIWESYAGRAPTSWEVPTKHRLTLHGAITRVSLLRALR